MTGAGCRPYSHAEIEPRWQQAWQAVGAFAARRNPQRPKWFIVELPPFATGQLHVGHARNYVLADVDARFRRAMGYDVLYTSGFDTFGLPTELAARQAGCSPHELARSCSVAMGEQFVRLGLSHDRARITQYHEPAFYRWVQYVFVRLFDAGHCFRREANVAWCPSCEVSLASSLVDDGRCWRCGTAVVTKMQEQWFVREAAFADEMLAGMDSLAGWPDAVKKIHKDWIGRREVLELRLPLRGMPEVMLELDVDAPAINDARYLIVGGQHGLALNREHGEIAAHAQVAGPNGLPIDLPVVVDRDDASSGVRFGRLAASDKERLLAEAAGINVEQGGTTGGYSISEMLRTGQARRVARYRLQDWNIARDRYWGPPVPIIHCEVCGPVPVPPSDLPVALPEDVDLSYPGNPLTRHPTFLSATCPQCLRPARRDAETLEAYSSPWWYHWLCKSPDADDPFNRDDAHAWLPVDLMVGGADQVRTCFFHVRMMACALRQMGIADVAEPVQTLIALGMVKADSRKMSKSAGNAIDLDALVERHGADAMRMAILSAAAPENDFNWSDSLIRKQRSFLLSIWDFVHRVADSSAAIGASSAGASAPSQRAFRERMKGWLATGTKRIERNYLANEYHLVVRNLEFLVERTLAFEGATRKAGNLQEDDLFLLTAAARRLVQCLAPLAPHIAEQMWVKLGGEGMVAQGSWPVRHRPPETDTVEEVQA